MKKKVVAAMLAACMAVSLTACGNKENPDKIPQRQRQSLINQKIKRSPKIPILKKKRQELFL